ncbi:MAG: hypothetical protein AVDCRST_MAG49-2323, partial [uncultured Thermomicrobiales bacterium]
CRPHFPPSSVDARSAGMSSRSPASTAGRARPGSRVAFVSGDSSASRATSWPSSRSSSRTAGSSRMSRRSLGSRTRRCGPGSTRRCGRWASPPARTRRGPARPRPSPGKSAGASSRTSASAGSPPKRRPAAWRRPAPA